MLGLYRLGCCLFVFFLLAPVTSGAEWRTIYEHTEFRAQMDHTAALVRQAGQPDAPQIAIFVSPIGRDDGAGDEGDPFASISRAKEMVASLRENTVGVESITVFLRRGSYYLDEPLLFGPQAGGSVADNLAVVYAAYPGEDVVISGGRPITGWRQETLHGQDVWVTNLPDVAAGNWYFHQLFVDGNRRFRTRVPHEGFYQMEGRGRVRLEGFGAASRVVVELYDDLPDVSANTNYREGEWLFTYHADDVDGSWTNLRDVHVLIPHFWRKSRVPIRAVLEDDQAVMLQRASIFRLTDDFSLLPASYYLENVFEALIHPGQWYLDRQSGDLYYLPKDGEEPTPTTVVAPVLPQLLRVQGAENIHFQGITFAHTEDSQGMLVNHGQSVVQLGAALDWEDVQQSSLQNSTLRNVGSYGLSISGNSKDNLVENNRIVDLGAGGVLVGHNVTRTMVRANEIAHGGNLFAEGVGIWIGDSPRNMAVNNHIHHFYYTGISVGWSWGYAGNARGNIIEHNHIHHIGQGVLSDLGAIYTLGEQTGTVVRHNHIHDVQSRGYGGWGLYPDEGSTGILFENNLVYRTSSGGFHQHYGKNTIVHNNIFFGKGPQINRQRTEPHLMLTFTSNIVFFDAGSRWLVEVFGRQNWDSPSPDRFFFDNNVYFEVSEETEDLAQRFRFGGYTWDRWRRLGMDVHSTIADPQFSNPYAGDFSLPPDSPSLKLGFEPFEVPDFRRVSSLD